MEKFTIEKSKEQVVPIGKINKLAFELDVDYLEDALKQMENNQSFRESAGILDPDQSTHLDRMDLNRAKLKQLRLMLEIAKNSLEIKKITERLNEIKQSDDVLRNMFG